ncbi:PREDICTED: probable palmitoyltransferase ZDHHC12 [Nanorana parkeri]|uniref:probable palmitoyltransferase ZDHHC12 n=1 Tax=Nanorana parkeri TaxID=125878 RepID=UPI0008547DB9|nr:PREDICTED: probable palmitoyltransferase ZDHHC12 [Nanorana parkeri]
MSISVLLSSGCLVRTGHTLLTWGVILVLFLHDTDLYHQETQWIYVKPLLFVVAVLCSVGLYFAVSLMDPGYVLSDREEKTFSAPAEQETSPLTSSTVRSRRCGYCLLKQPMRARHCKSCNHCVRRFDHHCPWIENCVGEKNHRVFMLYLTVQLVVLLWAFRLAWSGFHFEATWIDWLRLNVFLLLAFILVGIFTAVVGLLLACHLYLISCNFTTWEFMSYYRISYLKQRDSDSNPFDRGTVRNLWNFFCTGGHVIWERVYLRNTYDAV